MSEKCDRDAGRACTAALLAALVALAVPAHAGNDVSGPPSRELHIGRLVHGAGPQSGVGPGRAWWRIDWPEAERHFLDGVARCTVIDTAADSAHLSLLDDALFDRPWPLVQQPGRLIAAINFDMDTGDGREHADDPACPVAMTSFAYRVGINYRVYALTP